MELRNSKIGEAVVVEVVICGLKGTVKAIFDIAGFSALLPICPSVSGAAKLVM